MLLTERLKSIKNEVATIRESMTVVDPRSQSLSADEGVSRRDRAIAAQSSPRHLMAVAECADLLRDVMSGARPDWHFREAMSTSDFPGIFGSLLYRQMLGNYKPWPVTYPDYFRIVEVKDLHELNMYTLDGGNGILDPIGEYEPYPEVHFTEGNYKLKVAKYGKRYGISLEMVLQDDMNSFQSRPRLMAQGARRSEEYLATSIMFDVNGPDATFFSAGNRNIITGNPPLSLPAFQTAFKVLAAQKGVDNEPIVIDAVRLVVTPADEVTARNILNATEIRVTEAGGTSNQMLITQNWMRNRVKLSINPYIPTIASSATGNPWMLLADPNDLTQRPAFMFGFLRGRREPKMWVQDPDAIPLGGGSPDPLDGSFDNDAINYKLRHFFGVAQGDPKMAVASNGSGS